VFLGCGPALCCGFVAGAAIAAIENFDEATFGRSLTTGRDALRLLSAARRVFFSGFSGFVELLQNGLRCRRIIRIAA
jgi:hypothetical protein